jgi:microcystin-dependent protein
MPEQFMGAIQALGFQFAPLNYAYCSGSLIPVSQNAALFSLLGTSFGGNGQTTFGLPDLRGRTPIGQFQGPGLSARVMGQQAGAETHVLSSLELPTHTHAHSYSGGSAPTAVSVAVAKTAGKNQTPNAGDYIGMPGNALGAQGNLYVSAADVAAAGTSNIGGVSLSGGAEFDDKSLSIATAGGSQAFPTLQPSLVINYCICTSGIFPSRS